MAEELQNPNPEPTGEGQPPAGDPVTPPTTPTPNDQVRQLQDQLAEQQRLAQENLQNLQAQYQDQLFQLANQPNQTPATPEITQEDVDEDPSKLSAYVQQEADKKTRGLQEQLQNTQVQTTAQLQSLAVQQAKMDPDMPHFSRFEKEINKTLQGVQSVNSEVIRSAYDYVVGSNMKTLLDEEREKMLRTQSTGGNNQLTPGSHTGGKPTTPADENYSADKVLSESMKKTLEEKGTTPDFLARKLGFSDFITMEKSRESLKEMEQEQNDIWLRSTGDEWREHLKTKKAGAA